MVWVVAVVGFLLVLAIAAAFVGGESFRLGHEAPAAIFDLDEAVHAIADGLPASSQARLTHDEVRTLIVATLGHLRSKGLTALPGEELNGRRQEADVVVADRDAVAAALGAIDRQGLDVADEDAYEVIRGLLVHLAAIGALGPPA